MADKQTLKMVVREQFFTLNQLNKKAVVIRDEYRKKLSTLEAQRKTYAPEYIEDQQNRARQDRDKALAALYEDYSAQVVKLDAALTELNGQLDLTSPALSNALKLIDMIGPDLVGADLESSIIEKINQQFVGDQSALKVLRAAYKAKGVIYDGGLDKQIYNEFDAVRQIFSRAEEAFLHDGSINALAAIGSKYATLEGFTDFETMPDSIGFDEALHQGAGL
jgi:hypothetical protein